MGMSACMGTLSFAWAAWEYKQFKCMQYSLGLAYWGVMEWLQVVQHWYAAGPEDNYAMCANPINQHLTDAGSTHIIFQPLFTCMTLMSMFRRHDIAARIESDLIFNLCLFGGLWWVCYPWACALMGVDQTFMPVATEECPNYMWLREGYDASLGATTPNLEHKPCTYYAPTTSGHLAWAVPTPKQTYFNPGASVHFFMMFAPYFVMFKRRLALMGGVFVWLTGPVMASYITKSVNEQPAIWCLYSVLQSTLFGIVVRWTELHKHPILDKIHHPGGYGEQPLTYYAVHNSSEKEALLAVVDSSEESKVL